jgi:hypothetical protein
MHHPRSALLFFVIACLYLTPDLALAQASFLHDRGNFVTDHGLKDALARLRKFGGRCVLGFQSIAQVSTTYGHGTAQTLICRA